MHKFVVFEVFLMGNLTISVWPRGSVSSSAGPVFNQSSFRHRSVRSSTSSRNVAYVITASLLL